MPVLVRGRSAWEELLGDAEELTERVERYVSLTFDLMRENEALDAGLPVARLGAMGEAPGRRGARRGADQAGRAA